MTTKNKRMVNARMDMVKNAMMDTSFGRHKSNEKGMNMKEMCQIMKDLRQDHDLTQKEVAACLGISQQCYSGYERGRCGVPTEIVVALAKLYQVSADYLLGLDTNYCGGINLMSIYYDDVTMFRVVYDIRRIKKSKRRELLSYIRFLAEDDVQEVTSSRRRGNHKGLY